jgi:hypothetical protein
MAISTLSCPLAVESNCNHVPDVLVLSVRLFMCHYATTHVIIKPLLKLLHLVQPLLLAVQPTTFLRHSVTYKLRCSITGIINSGVEIVFIMVVFNEEFEAYL